MLLLFLFVLVISLDLMIVLLVKEATNVMVGILFPILYSTWICNSCSAMTILSPLHTQASWYPSNLQAIFKRRFPSIFFQLFQSFFFFKIPIKANLCEWFWGFPLADQLLSTETSCLKGNVLFVNDPTKCQDIDYGGDQYFAPITTNQQYHNPSRSHRTKQWE